MSKQHHGHTQIEQDVIHPIQPLIHSVTHSRLGTLLLGMALLMVGATLFSPKKGKMTTGRFGGRSEQWRAAAIARQQRKNRQAHKVALKAGNLPIPHAQQSVTVTGAPDSGKTFSIIDPAIRSAIAQGFPVLVYDFKGSQLEAHAAWAAAQGYEWRYLRPVSPILASAIRSIFCSTKRIHSWLPSSLKSCKRTRSETELIGTTISLLAPVLIW